MTDAPHRSIPLYALYGDEGAVEDHEFVHIEDLASRSSLYGWEIKPHTHAALFQVLVVSDGTAQVALDEQAQAVHGPAVIVVPAGTVHGFQMTPGTTGMVLSVATGFLEARPDAPDAQVLNEVLSHPIILDYSHSPGRFQSICGTVAAIRAEFRWPQRGRSMMFDALLRGLMVLLRRKIAAPIERDNRQNYRRTVFIRFRNLVEDHYRDRWRITDYTSTMGISESALNRVCEHFTNKTAFEVLQDRILLEAQRYLIYTAAPITQITYDLGFTDAGYFCRYFKRRTGESPKAFRNARNGSQAAEKFVGMGRQVASAS